MADAPTPEWWVSQLYARLVRRRQMTDLWTRYYEGDHPLPWLAPQAREEFRRILKMTRSNYMGLVCDAIAEREQIEGFRVADTNDKESWRIWQANDLDSYSDQGILDAHITGFTYMLVAPNPQDPSTPFAWMEHPSQAIVAFEPGSGRRVRRAGLKVWVDEWTAEVHATLYLPDVVAKYRAKAADASTVQWSRRETSSESWYGPNPLREVPLVEIPNRPRLLAGGVSEIADVTDVQDRINKTIADRLITQDYGAFPQKWATAWPEEDSAGKPNPPIDVGRNRMITTDVQETKFGQFEAAPLDPYSAAKREDVKDIASRTRTPAQYLLGEMSNVNGETLKASESGLVSKVRQSCRTLGEGFESGVRLMRKAAGLPSDLAMETVWRDPQYRTEGERTDAVVKRFQAKLIPWRQAVEDLGYSQTQISRMEEMFVAEANDPVLAALTRPLVTDAASPGIG